MPTSPTPELHGCEGEVRLGFDEETALLERVTVTDRAEAIRLITDHFGYDAYGEIDPQPVHMRWVTDVRDLADHLPVLTAAEVPCWLECPADHPDAVPFWKDVP